MCTIDVYWVLRTDPLYKLRLWNGPNHIAETDTWENGTVNEVPSGFDFYWSLKRANTSSCCKQICQQMTESKVCQKYIFHTIGTSWWPQSSGLCTHKIYEKSDATSGSKGLQKIGTSIVWVLKDYYRRQELVGNYILIIESIIQRVAFNIQVGIILKIGH